ncbi:hypothetical protein XHV734_4522 [Xanthomonas hortorum pv. vitians]|nr:hypothetical protein XHV734_4522 [Xanthomonas hortorum pv. vitians]
MSLAAAACAACPALGPVNTNGPSD